MSMSQVNQWHIAMIGPILYQIGSKEGNAKKYYYTMLGTLAASIIFTVRRPKKLNYRGIVNLSHYALILPSFLYIVYRGNELPNWSFKIIKYLGISVIAIHLYNFYKRYNS